MICVYCGKEITRFQRLFYSLIGKRYKFGTSFFGITYKLDGADGETRFHPECRESEIKKNGGIKDGVLPMD